MEEPEAEAAESTAASPSAAAPASKAAVRCSLDYSRFDQIGAESEQSCEEAAGAMPLQQLGLAPPAAHTPFADPELAAMQAALALSSRGRVPEARALVDAVEAGWAQRDAHLRQLPGGCCDFDFESFSDDTEATEESGLLGSVPNALRYVA